MVWTAAEPPLTVGVAADAAGEAVPAGRAAASVVSLADRAGSRWPRAGPDAAAAPDAATLDGSGPGTDDATGPGLAADEATGPGAAAGADAPARAGRRRSGRLRRRPGRARGRDPWRTAFFAALALAIAGGAAWALLGSSLLVVRHEQVAGNRLVSAAKVLAAAGIRRGTPLASVNTMAAAHRVDQIAQVRSARVTRSFPDTVVITVRERTPTLAVRAAGGYALIDGSGVTVRWAARKPARMPVLRQPPAQLRGDPGVRAAAAVLARLPRHLRTLVVGVTAPSASAVTLALRDGVTVLWGSPAKDSVKAAEVTVLLRTHARYLDVSDPAIAVTHR
jgi:cell division protein FtsQ